MLVATIPLTILHICPAITIRPLINTAYIFTAVFLRVIKTNWCTIYPQFISLVNRSMFRAKL